jgi:Skp family chaperone for outer membrane proteins
MWQRMINKLNYGKRHIMELVEQSTSAFDQREELTTKLQILKERGQNDKTGHVQEMRELQRKLDHDAKLQEFLAVKGQQRLNTESEEREADKKKKRVEDMEKQLLEYDKIFQRINVSLSSPPNSIISNAHPLNCALTESLGREGCRSDNFQVH